MKNNMLSPDKENTANLNLEKLRKSGFEFSEVGPNHYRYSDKFDLWPTTGKFCDLSSGEIGQGIKHLIKKLNSVAKEAESTGKKINPQPVKRPINPNAPAHQMNIRTKIATDFMAALVAKYGAAPEVCDIAIAQADKFIERLNKIQEPKKNEQQ